MFLTKKHKRKDFTIMKNISQNDLKVTESIKKFLKEFNVIQFLRESNCRKLKGFPILNVFAYLLMLVYTKKSLYMNIQLNKEEVFCGKDVIYRFLNSLYINWNLFLVKLSTEIISKHIVELTSEKRLNALVVDDSFYGRERSKKVELLARVYDHASKGNRYKKGFRLLGLGWTDGNTFMPVNFSLLSSATESNVLCKMKENLKKNSVAYKRRLDAISKAPEVMLKMLKMAVNAKIPAKHVLFDSWFSYPKTLIEISKLGLHTVGRLKDTKTIKYLIDGKAYTLKEIYKMNKKRRGLSKYLLSVNVIIYNDSDEELEAKIVFVRDRNKKSKWIAIISTDLTLDEEAIIALYGKRWSIEVFFKVCKSYLKLSKEFQCISYDALTAHTALVMVRYMMLAVETRNSEDKRTMGEIFFFAYDEVLESRKF
jgi:hypothetical protein